jgi:inner membrane protein
VEPVTHALTSLALARATRTRLPRFGTAILIISGTTSDLDCLGYFAGPGAFLRFHRVVLHSLLGSAVLISVVAALAWWMNREFPPKKSDSPLSFTAAATFAGLGVLSHLLLDFSSGKGVQFLWPFHLGYFSWNLTTNFDPWILLLFVAGLLLPALFRLVSEEIGGGRSTEGLRRGASITIFLLLVYLGSRAFLHGRAVDLLYSREYRGRTPIFAGAFPNPSSPFNWRGVVFTDSTIEELNFSLAPGANFDPERTESLFKPQNSPALELGEQTPTAKAFLNYARFPVARVYPLENSTRFELRDLQFAPEDTSPENILARVDFDETFRIKREEFVFASSGKR